MLPASASYVTVGNGDPRSWIYTVTVDGPGSTVTVYRGGSGVAHQQYAVDPVQPWLGRPPWQLLFDAGQQVSAQRRRRPSGEAGDAGRRRPRAGRRERPGAAPSKDYKPERFGFAPPETAVEARRDVERSILAACGVPPVLANHAAPGTSMREAWRQFTVGTVEPLATIISDQLSEALGETVTLTMPRSADVATLARAVQSLAGAGMNIDQAREVVGLL